MKHLFCIILLLFSSLGFSQTGPGGIGNTDGTSSLELWLDGMDVNGDGTNPVGTVTTWSDKSGNGINVTENIANVATFSSPGVTFNNTRYLNGTDAGFPTGNASRTAFLVISTPNTDVDDIFFFYGTSATDQSYGISKAGLNVRAFFFANDLDAVNGWAPANQTKIVSNIYTSGVPGFRETYVDEVLSASGAPIRTPNTTLSAQGLQIGGWNSFNFYSNATIQEILFYSTVVNDAQRIIINNYLSARHS